MCVFEPAIQKLKDHLDALSPVVVNEMKALMTELSAWGADDDNIVFYRFEVQADGHYLTFGDIDIFQGAMNEPFMNGMHMIPENKFFLDLELVSNFDEIEQSFSTFHAAQAEIFFEWFSDCFMRAGGHRMEKPFLLCYNDDTDYFNLGTKKWIKQRDLIQLLTSGFGEELRSEAIHLERIYIDSQRRWWQFWKN